MRYGFPQKWIETKTALLIISFNLNNIWNGPVDMFIKSQLKCPTDLLRDRILLSWTNRHTYSNFMIISVGQYQNFILGRYLYTISIRFIFISTIFFKNLTRGLKNNQTTKGLKTKTTFIPFYQLTVILCSLPTGGM